MAGIGYLLAIIGVCLILKCHFVGHGGQGPQKQILGYLFVLLGYCCLLTAYVVEKHGLDLLYAWKGIGIDEEERATLDT